MAKFNLSLPVKHVFIHVDNLLPFRLFQAGLKMQEADDTGRDDEVWQLGVLVENTKLENSFHDLRSNPMRLLAWFSPPPPPRASRDGAALAMCKLSLFNTFDNVHEYQAKKGVPLRAASTVQCRYPHVTLATYCYMTSGRETVLMNLDSDSHSLEPNTGLSTPTTPTILVASQSFLVTHGYSHMEVVWVQLFSPLPLERVILSGRQSSETALLTPSLAGQAMQYLAHLVEQKVVLVRQDTYFSLPGLYSASGSEEKKHVTLDLSILECHPVLQGRLTIETEMVVLPQGEGAEVALHSLAMPMTSSSELCQDSSVEESWEESKSRSESALSNCSASDFRNEEELPSDPSLEVATHPGIKLHKHYIVVPKTFAKEHELFQYQNVLLVAESRQSAGTAGLADVVLSTRARRDGGAEGSHAAVMIWYDGQSELERYLPPPYPGYMYEQEALQCAYVHPHLLYSVFHETLSPTRRYFISVKVSYLTHTLSTKAWNFLHFKTSALLHRQSWCW